MENCAYERSPTPASKTGQHKSGFLPHSLNAFHVTYNCGLPPLWAIVGRISWYSGGGMTTNRECVNGVAVQYVFRATHCDQLPLSLTAFIVILTYTFESLVDYHAMTSHGAIHTIDILT